jgi:hypothetical protein
MTDPSGAAHDQDQSLVDGMRRIEDTGGQSCGSLSKTVRPPHAFSLFEASRLRARKSR